MDDFFGETGETDNLPEHLSAGLSLDEALSRSSSPLPFTNMPDHLSTGFYPRNPQSRSPSPLPSPLPFINPPDSKLWENRYKLHDEAFSDLSSIFFGPHQFLDPSCLRYILMPLLILALVSRKNSPEREICFSYFAQFKEYMAKNYPSGGSPGLPSPQGGQALDFDISWDKLDAYSAKVEEERRGNTMLDEAELTKGAPEWNWWDMLKEIQIDVICKYKFLSMIQSQKTEGFGLKAEFRPTTASKTNSKTWRYLVLPIGCVRKRLLHLTNHAETTSSGAWIPF